MNDSSTLTVRGVLQEMEKVIEEYNDKLTQLGILRKGYKGEPPLASDEEIFFMSYWNQIEKCYKRLQELKDGSTKQSEHDCV